MRWPVLEEVSEKPYKILVADDDEFVHALIKVSLMNTKYRLAFVKTGMQALELIQTHPPDIVIADGMMPELNGFELVEDLKRWPQTSGIPVILLTGVDEPRAWAAGAARARADLELPKPFKIGTILSCLKKAERLVENHRTSKNGFRRFDPDKFYVRWRLGAC
ncbi:MAG TPA: response regulator [Blastocatellia bacterium]|nr:response regulator [Blastocatellia bacterium]